MADPTPLAPGDRAPDFTLPDQFGQEWSLASALGEKAVLVVFFPYAFSGVCTGELIGFRDRLGDFETETTTLATLSCDSLFAQRAFADRDALFFPVLSDFWPHGEVARGFGVFSENRGAPRRSAFVIGRDGVVDWAVHAEWGSARDLDEMAAALATAGARA